MASKRTENTIIAVIAALGMAVIISKYFEPSSPPVQLPNEPAPIAIKSEPPIEASLPNVSSSRKMTDADRAYYDGAFASQAEALRSAERQNAGGGAAQRAREVAGMTEAAKSAGYDDATATRLGSEAAALCNGDPECLK